MQNKQNKKFLKGRAQKKQNQNKRNNNKTKIKQNRKTLEKTTK